MRDTIYRDDAIRVASGYCHPANVAKELGKLPSAEPQIIRCKECKFNIEKDVCFCILWNHLVYKDDFCSHAQKMEVDNEQID